MSSFAPSLPQSNRAAPRQLPIPQLSPETIIAVTLLACVAVGALMAYDFKLGIGVLVGLCYLPLALVNLPLGIALWVPTTFLTGLPGISTASQAAGLVIALAWLGTLRSHAHDQGKHVPRGLLAPGGRVHRLAVALDGLGRGAGACRSPRCSPGWGARSCSPCS